jgi:hypothetical protein
MSGSLPPVYVYGAFSDFLETKILDHVFRNVPYTPPTALWVALYLLPGATDTGAGAEPPDAAGYVRLPVTFVPGTAGVDGSSTLWNDAVLQWPVATGAWGTVTWVGIHDAATLGNMLAHGPLGAIKVVDGGDAVRFGANQFVIGLQ